MAEFELTPQMVSFLLIAVYLLGAAARVVWPYALAYLKEPQKFDWAMAKGQIIATAIGLIGVILSGMIQDGFVEGLGAVGYIGAFIAGFGAAAVGREGQKTADLKKKPQ